MWVAGLGLPEKARPRPGSPEVGLGTGRCSQRAQVAVHLCGAPRGPAALSSSQHFQGCSTLDGGGHWGPSGHIGFACWPLLQGVDRVRV